MRILVTGGAGFIGSHVVDQLIDQSHSVFVLDNFCAYYDPRLKRANIACHLNSNAIQLFEGDILDYKLVYHIIENAKIEIVIHLAALAGVQSSISNPAIYQMVNCQGFLNVLEACRKLKVNRLVFASSSSVYGNAKYFPVNEVDTTDKPISPYAATKKACELIAYSYHQLYNISVLCLRLFTVFGPRQRPDMAIHTFTERILRGEPVIIYGNSKCARDYTYVSDVVDGIIACLSVSCGFEIINLGSSQMLNLKDLVQKLEQLIGKPATVINRPVRTGDVIMTLADIAKASRIFNYAPRIGIDEGLKRFYQWFLKRRIPE